MPPSVLEPRPDRRTLLQALAAAGLGGLAALSPTAVLAQPQGEFRPARPVRLVSPLLAGGATDAIVRPLALRLGERWGQSVVVENHAGGGTVIGTQIVANAPPDGLTFGVAISALTINPSLRTDLPYDTFRDITPICQIGSVSGALVAHPSLPADDVGGLIALAKARPGEISWASLGIGTGGHITGELLCKRAGIQMVHVPFNGSSAAYRDMLPGRVPVGFVVLESAMPHVRSGKLKLLALTDRQRNKLLPEVPILSETVPDTGFESVFGFIGPRKLPAATADAMNADIVRVLREPEASQRLADQFMVVVGSSREAFASVIRREVDYWKLAVKESGAHVN